MRPATLVILQRQPLPSGLFSSTTMFYIIPTATEDRYGQWPTTVQLAVGAVTFRPKLMWLKEVECTLVQALRLCTCRTAHRGSRGIALSFHDHGTRSGWGVSVTPRPLFTPGKDPVPIVQEAGWAAGPVWTGAENLAPTGIRSPDRPARSQSAIPPTLPYPQIIVVMDSTNEFRPTTAPRMSVNVHTSPAHKNKIYQKYLGPINSQVLHL